MQETGFFVRQSLYSKTSSLPYVCIQPAADLIRKFLFTVYNVLQVCHEGHSQRGIDVTVPTDEKLNRAKKRTLKGGEGEESKGGGVRMEKEEKKKEGWTEGHITSKL